MTLSHWKNNQDNKLITSSADFRYKMLTSVPEVVVLWTNTENWIEKQEQLEKQGGGKEKPSLHS